MLGSSSPGGLEDLGLWILGISNTVLVVLLELGVPFDKPVAKTLADSFLFWLKRPKYITVELWDILCLKTYTLFC